MKRALAALAVAAAAACNRAPPVVAAPVRFYVAPGLPGERVSELARGFQIANPTLVDRIDDAEVAWLTDPPAALALGDRAAPGSAPEQPGLPDEFADPKRRFAPVGAIARVIVTLAGDAPAFAPDELRELADPRLRGKVAIARLDRRSGALLVAALELGHGERGVGGWLEQLAANQPILAASDAEVVARVEAGTAQVGLTDSLAVGGAAGREGLRVVFPVSRDRPRRSLSLPKVRSLGPGSLFEAPSVVARRLTSRAGEGGRLSGSAAWARAAP